MQNLLRRCAERDKQVSEAKREAKAFKTEQAGWAKTQKGLEVQVGGARLASKTA